MKVSIRLFLALFIWVFLVLPAWALDPVYSDFFGKAIRGYDPVAYFKQNKPVEGEGEYTHEWMGAKWYFSSKENLKSFSENPGKYAPQYGGYCAWAVSEGYTAKIDPHAWNLHEGKLYLNYNKSVQKTWQQDIPGNIVKADKNWPKLLSDK